MIPRRSGLGEATARLLFAQDKSVLLGAQRVDRLQSLAAELTGSGGKALAVTTDVTRYDQVKRLVDAAMQAKGSYPFHFSPPPTSTYLIPPW